MHAYMSTPNPAYVIPDRHDMPSERMGLSGAMALDEARAILAETEPDGPEMGHRNRYQWRVGVKQALAEALTAFLEA